MTAQDFINKYGEKTVVKFDRPGVMTIRDDYASPFSSGRNGYITEVRVENGELQFYHNWWAYGWISEEELRKKYPRAHSEVMRRLKTPRRGC
jgi:hypothetical protein